MFQFRKSRYWGWPGCDGKKGIAEIKCHNIIHSFLFNPCFYYPRHRSKRTPVNWGRSVLCQFHLVLGCWVAHMLAKCKSWDVLRGRSKALCQYCMCISKCWTQPPFHNCASNHHGKLLLLLTQLQCCSMPNRPS